LSYLGDEFTLVNVEVSAADTASLDLDLVGLVGLWADVLQTTYQDIIVAQGGQRNVDDGVGFGLLISESLHGLRESGTHGERLMHGVGRR
jgi:hypothetical protein